MPRVNTIHLKIKPSLRQLGLFSLLWLGWSTLLWVGLLLVENSGAEGSFPVQTVLLVVAGAVFLSFLPYPVILVFYLLQRKKSWLVGEDDIKMFIGPECSRSINWVDVQDIRLLPHCVALDTTTATPTTETVWFVTRKQANRLRNHFIDLKEKKRVKQLEEDREAAGGGLV